MGDNFAPLVRYSLSRESRMWFVYKQSNATLVPFGRGRFGNWEILDSQNASENNSLFAKLIHFCPFSVVHGKLLLAIGDFGLR